MVLLLYYFTNFVIGHKYSDYRLLYLMPISIILQIQTLLRYFLNKYKDGQISSTCHSPHIFTPIVHNYSIEPVMLNYTKLDYTTS